MTEPKIVQKGPFVEEVEAGDYFWCACGLSASQPYCDGSHKGTGLAPMKVTLEEGKKVAWCGCRRTGNPPYCDGSHSQI